MPSSIDEVVKEGTVLGERYRLDHLLGEGGMGRVYRGLDLAQTGTVAVKVMHRALSFDPVLSRRFEREARAAMMISHPNVVRVLDFGHERNTRYIVMEYIEGVSLSDVIESCPPGSMPLRDVVDLLAQVADALGAAHGKGLVHRDLKPDNVIVSESSAGRVARVLDFGLVKMSDPEVGATLTQADQVAGTPAYMSPEQCRSLAVGPAADLYSLGCILHEMLTGASPFSGASAIDVIARQMFLPIPAATRAEGAEPIAAPLECLRKDLLAKAPEERPQDAASVAERLRKALRASAPRVRPTPPRGSRPPRGTAFPSGRPDAQEGSSITIARMQAGGERALDDELVLALGAQGVACEDARSIDDLRAAPVDVVVVEGSNDVGAVEALVRTVTSELADLSVLAVLTSISNDDLSSLIESGAGDVARSPFDAETLARKLRRLARRRRRAT